MRTEPNHWNHRTATFAAALAGSLLLAGCGGLSVPGFGGGSDAEEAPGAAFSFALNGGMRFSPLTPCVGVFERVLRAPALPRRTSCCRAASSG